jgi:hypothetical protein
MCGEVMVRLLYSMMTGLNLKGQGYEVVWWTDCLRMLNSEHFRPRDQLLTSLSLLWLLVQWWLLVVYHWVDPVMIEGSRKWYLQSAINVAVVSSSLLLAGLNRIDSH